MSKAKQETYEGPILVLKAKDGRWQRKGGPDIHMLDLFLLLIDRCDTVGGRLFGKNAGLTVAKGFTYHAKVKIKEHVKYGPQVQKLESYKSVPRDKVLFSEGDLFMHQGKEHEFKELVYDNGLFVNGIKINSVYEIEKVSY